MISFTTPIVFRILLTVIELYVSCTTNAQSNFYPNANFRASDHYNETGFIKPLSSPINFGRVALSY